MSSAENRIDEALKILFKGVQWDEAHHMAWKIDQVVRALTGCPEVTRTSPWGEQYVTLGESLEYLDFVAKYKDGENGPDTYRWDTGIAP